MRRTAQLPLHPAVLLVASCIVAASAVAVTAFSAGYAISSALHAPIVVGSHTSAAQQRELTRFVGTVLRDRANCIKNNAINVPRCKAWLQQ